MSVLLIRARRAARPLLPALGAILSSSSAFAQNLSPPVEVAMLDQVVVTATRQASRDSEQIASVELIDREMIERSGAQSLAELLAGVPGVRLTSNGGAGSNSAVYLRGAESRHTLLLVDGMRVGSATTGQPTFELLPVGLIDRIEILRGPASALYGSEAIGGVIQVFTRRGEGPFKPQVFAGYGSDQTRRIEASAGGAHERLRYSIGAGHFATDGINANPDPVKQPKYYQPDRDGFEEHHVSASVAAGFGEDDEAGVSLFASQGRNRFDAYSSAFDAFLDKRLSAANAWLRNRLAPGWTSTLRLGQSVDALKNYSDASKIPSRFDTTQRQLVWQHDIALAGGMLLAAYERLEQDVDGTTDYVEDSRSIDSLLLGWRRSFGEHQLQLNARHDDNSQFGGKTTGQLGYGYQIDAAWRIKASIASAFNAPTFNQLYWPDAGFGGGNPALKPEKALNRELGLQWAQGGQLVTLTYFNNKVTDLIAGWPPVNVGEARLEGVELGYQAAFGPWQFAAGADLLDATDRDTGKELPRRASEAGFARIDRELGDWRMGLEWRGEGRRYDNTSNTRKMGGYGLLNAYAHYQLERDWRLELRADNLLDKDYERAWGYGTPDASVFVGVRWAPR